MAAAAHWPRLIFQAVTQLVDLARPWALSSVLSSTIHCECQRVPPHLCTQPPSSNSQASSSRTPTASVDMYPDPRLHPKSSSQTHRLAGSTGPTTPGRRARRQLLEACAWRHVRCWMTKHPSARNQRWREAFKLLATSSPLAAAASQPNGRETPPTRAAKLSTFPIRNAGPQVRCFGAAPISSKIKT